MLRTTPMFRNDVLTHWTNDKVDAENSRRSRVKRGKRAAPFVPATYHQIYLVFADRVEAADLANYQTATASAAHFSDDDFRGLVHFHAYDNTYTSETRTERSTRRFSASSLPRAAFSVREDYAAGLTEQARYDNDPMYALKLELASADWFYTFSDDGGVFRAGEAHFRKISELVRKAGDTGQTLFDDTARAVHAQSKTV